MSVALVLLSPALGSVGVVIQHRPDVASYLILKVLFL
jgi:hypothetical protein